jgi:hypothetical protein
MSERTCSACGRHVMELRAKLCRSCAEKSGIVPMGRAMRPAAPCGRCGHPEIVRVQMRERTAARGDDANAEVPRPLALTWAVSTDVESSSSTRGTQSAEPRLDAMFGLVEAYVCRACGAIELFAREPEKIPIGPEYGTELIVVKPGTYRT